MEIEKKDVPLSLARRYFCSKKPKTFGFLLTYSYLCIRNGTGSYI
jgi:hypothetical protein